MLNLLHKDSAPVSRETQGLATYYVPLGRLVDNTYQPRQYNDPDHVLGIAKSLIDLQATLPETKGLQQVPIGRIMRWADSTPVPAVTYGDPDELRRLINDGEYVVEMAFGHSRRLAFDVLANGVGSIFPQLKDTDQVAFNGREFDPATYAEMPIVVLPLTDRQMWEQAVVENAARRDISAIEKAHALKRGVDELGMNISDAARALDMSRSAASNLLRLLDLPEAFQEAIVNGVMSETHGRTLLTMRPAMHLVKGTPADLGAMTRKELELHVAKLISACTPLPAQKNTIYKTLARWSDGTVVQNQYNPPVWAYDWQPAAPWDSPDIVGACDGCQWRVTFAGEAGPRCSQVQAVGRRDCYEAKTQVWKEYQMHLQRAVIECPAAPPAEHTSTAPADTSNVSRETQAAAPAANVYVPENAIETPTWFKAGHQYATAPAVLIEKGMCGPEQCKCFVVAYNQYLDGGEVRPDPEHAPNMCYGCTSAQRLARRKQELEYGDMTAKRAAIKAENAACTLMLRDAFYVLTAQDLWHNSEFMRDLLKAGSLSNGMGQRSNQIDSMDALSIQETIWMHVAKGKCTSWSQFQVDGDSQHWNMPMVQEWLKKIGTGFGRQVGGVWAQLLEQEKPAQSIGELDL